MDWASASSGVLSFLGQQDTNRRLSREGRLDRDFQREMSNTAYQRAVADMRKAGINPILAYQKGGASTPGGRGVSGFQNPVEKGFATAFQVAQLRNTNALTDVNKANEGLTTAKEVNQKADTFLKHKQAEFVQNQIVEKQIANSINAQELQYYAKAGFPPSVMRTKVQNVIGTYLWENMPESMKVDTVSSMYKLIKPATLQFKKFSDNPDKYIRDILKPKMDDIKKSIHEAAKAASKNTFGSMLPEFKIPKILKSGSGSPLPSNYRGYYDKQ